MADLTKIKTPDGTQYNLKDTVSGYTTNTGTVTSVTAGIGLTGSVTTAGTIKAKLKSETTSTLSSEEISSTENRQYAINPDSDGNLSVNVPWTDTTDYNSLINKPTNVSDFTNDAGYMVGMTILSYGSSTWQNFIDAYADNKVVYTRASSNSNPASGSQTRLAFMAYVNNAATPTEVEFQYYRSVSSHGATQQGDQVYVYKLTKTGGWTVTVREAMSKIAVAGGLTTSYASGTITISGAAKQDTLVSGTNIKTINNESLLGSGDITISGGDTVTYTQAQTSGNELGTITINGTGTKIYSPTETDPAFTASAAHGISSSDITNWNGKQAALVSGTNIKTINSTSLLGSGDITVQPTLVSGTNIKTVNNESLLGSGNITVSTTAAQIIRW